MNRKHSEKSKLGTLQEMFFSNLRYKILCVFIALIIYGFYMTNTYGSKTYVVPLEIKTSEVIMVDSNLNKAPDNVLITLTGSKQELSSDITAGNFSAYVDISPKVKSGTYDFFVEIVPDESVLERVRPMQLSVKPEKVTLSLEESKVGYVKVVPALSGQPAHGYETTSVSFEPTTVEVHGPKSIIDSLESIQTKAVDIDGISKTKTVEVALTDVNNFVLVDKKPVSVTVGIQPVFERKTLTGLRIEYGDLDPDYSIVTKAPSIDITVEGNLLNIENLRNSDFSVAANCAAVDGEGTFLVPVFVYSPANVQVFEQSIASISVKAIRKNIEIDPDANPEQEAF